MRGVQIVLTAAAAEWVSRGGPGDARDGAWSAPGRTGAGQFTEGRVGVKDLVL
jgi:hypothetical protein